MRGRLAISLLLVCAACGAGGEEPPVSGELIVGSSDYAGVEFVDVVDGAEVELVPGAQSGFHVWLGLKVHGAKGRLYLEREARRVEDDVLVLRGQRQLVEVPDDAMNDWWVRPTASPAFMCPSPLGIQVWDQEICFDVTLTDEDGELVAEDSIILVPTCPDGDERDFCFEICSG
jgi:hypothetical protein